MAEGKITFTVEQLQVLLETLKRAGCRGQFCPGSDVKPRDMETCFVCDQIHWIENSKLPADLRPHSTFRAFFVYADEAPPNTNPLMWHAELADVFALAVVVSSSTGEILRVNEEEWSVDSDGIPIERLESIPRADVYPPENGKNAFISNR